MGMVCTPIFINTFVVFVRLYWFERRFQNVVREARNIRRTRSHQRADTKDDGNADIVENGIRGRSIVVLHNGKARLDEAGQSEKPETEKALNDTSDESRTGSSTSRRDANEAFNDRDRLTSQQSPAFRRDITFADVIKESDNNNAKPAMLPQRLSPEEHIKFLENQRNPKDKGALRIPGPRDFDRGSVPEPLLDDENNGDMLDYHVTNPVERRDMLNGEIVRRNVTIDAPDHPRLRTNTGNFPKLSSRKSVTLDKLKEAPTEDLGSEPNPIRARTGTLSSLRIWGTKENEPPTPYLSWQPTIGRNSAFVDLTEEQREELGGIEYRSLKTLAVVLVCKSHIAYKANFYSLLLTNAPLSLLLSLSFVRGHHPGPLDSMYRHLGICS